MTIRSIVFCVSVCLELLVTAHAASAQIVESVGGRALGMGGAFVAVANDSSATWWNPGALADGPFIDMALAGATTGVEEGLPAWRDRTSGFALATPPFGFSVYRLKITDIQPFDPTGSPAADRQDRRAGVPVRSLAATQIGVTLVQTLLSGIHAGATLKYLRGTLRGGREDGLLPPSELLDIGEDYEGGEPDQDFDVDVGVLTVTGPVRLGVVGRNLTEPRFGESAFTLPRQIRLGAAFDASQVGGTPLTIAADVDIVEYDAMSGERRVVAVGAEQWLWSRRLGVRGGARFNRAGREERSATAGVSVSPRSGLYVDAHIVRGGSDEDRGWGVSTRVSF